MIPIPCHSFFWITLFVGTTESYYITIKYVNIQYYKNIYRQVWCGMNSKLIGLKLFALDTIASNFVLYHCVKQIKNIEQHRNFLSDRHQNLISTNLYQDATEYKVSSISEHKFLSYSVHKILKTYRQTDWQTNRHFLKIVKSCSGHLKTCKSIENRKSKIFANPILSSYVYRRK